MCAIAGMIDLTCGNDVIAKMRQTMYRRGPDGWGQYQEGPCTLLHARLAIIDPAGGRQPMTYSQGGEVYTLVYNGELYNTEEIRQELIKSGHCFEEHSDTEVVLHAYAQWKEGCLERFNGIFAFAVWEKNAQRLFLARDRIGVKPLFYTQSAGGIVFASEMKTILCVPEVPRVLDEEGAAQILMLGPGRIPGSGVLKEIYEIKPGEYGFYQQGKLEKHRYWSLKDREHEDSFEETVEKVRYLVTDSIKRQMVSDVPIGTFLSGGLDSSIITAICAKEHERHGENLKTFSVDYLNNDRFFRPGKFQPNSDNAYIEKMLSAIPTEHHWTVLTPKDLSGALEEATTARDLPGMADVDFSLLAFCKEIRNEVKVALSGECADEIFGGYPWFRDPEIRAQEGFPWAQNTVQRAQLLVSGKTNAEEFVMEQYRKTCRESDILPGTSPQERRMKEMVNLNFQWFMQTLLDRKDRMSMYSGLEVRVPFCDYRIAEYLYGVPWEYKDYRGREKGLLRLAAQGLLPKEIVERKKSPYPKTFDPEYEQIMEARLNLILQEKNSPLFSIVNRRALQTLLEQESVWPWYGQLMKRPQMIAYFVQIEYWLRKYNVNIFA